VDEYPTAALETDPRFPSGPWAGFFQQKARPGRQPTEVELYFAGGGLVGEGRDSVGSYTVRGTYDPTDGRCEWLKQYRGKHAVAYTGYNQGKGVWGVWEISALRGLIRDKGVFHLWPLGMDVGDEPDRTCAAAREALGLPEETEGRIRTAVGLGGAAVAVLLLCVKLLPLLLKLFR
jgi:hypothetical protein